jgi:uncharacterized protein
MTDSVIHLQVPQEYQPGWENLTRELSGYARLAIAYSGGVDSTFLVWFAKTVLKKDALAILVVSPLVASRELAWARQTAQELGFVVEEVDLDVTVNSDVVANTRTRCYSCKKAMLGRMFALAHRLGYPTLMDGTNAEDVHEYRPGIQALQDFGVISPLARAGLSKTAIRELSRLGGLPTWNKPSQACLATRIPYGVTVTRELLGRIEQAEAYLLDLGCRQVRVRVHDRLARIELDPEDFSLLFDSAKRMRTVQYFCQLGFLQVSLDLAGYCSGNADVGSV